MLKLFFILLLYSFNLLPGKAITPEDYCKIHIDSKAPGTCVQSEKNDNCAIITTNLGTKECKKCVDGGCELTDCLECDEGE